MIRRTPRTKAKMKMKIHLNNLLPLSEAEKVLENASAYRIDIRMNEDAFYFWQIRNPDYEVTVKSPPTKAGKNAWTGLSITL